MDTITSYSNDMMIRILTLSGQFYHCPGLPSRNCLDCFKIVWTVFKTVPTVLNCPNGLKTVQTVIKQSGQVIKQSGQFKTVQLFQNCPASFQICFKGFGEFVLTVLKLFGLSQNCLDGFKTVQTIFSCFANCPDSSNTVWTVPTLS